jgi:ATP-dependent RNA helicase SUPV3L1/SUV3
LIAARDDAFALDPQGRILWQPGGPPAPIGRLLPGPTPLAPRLELALADSLSGQAREAVRRRVARWLDAHLASLTLPLRRLQAAAGLEGAGRGLCFLLVEGLGNVRTADARSLLKTLGAADRARLGRLGVRFGVRQIYLPAMLKPRAIDLRARLWATHRRAHGLDAPPAGAVAFAADGGQPRGFAEAIGFEQLGDSCLRIDIVERLAARLRALSRAGPFTLEPDLMAMTGLPGEQLAGVVEALGFEREGERYVRGKVRRRPSPRRPRRKSEPAASPFAALRQMLVQQ